MHRGGGGESNTTPTALSRRGKQHHSMEEGREQRRFVFVLFCRPFSSWVWWWHWVYSRRSRFWFFCFVRLCLGFLGWLSCRVLVLRPWDCPFWKVKEMRMVVSCTASRERVEKRAPPSPTPKKKQRRGHRHHSNDEVPEQHPQAEGGSTNPKKERNDNQHRAPPFENQNSIVTLTWVCKYIQNMYCNLGRINCRDPCVVCVRVSFVSVVSVCVCVLAVLHFVMRFLNVNIPCIFIISMLYF